MGYRYGISHINGISIWASTWNMGYRYGIWYIDMVIHHIDMVILDIDIGYGISIWEMTVSILSFWISIWDILSLWSLPCPAACAPPPAPSAALPPPPSAPTRVQPVPRVQRRAMPPAWTRAFTVVCFRDSFTGSIATSRGSSAAAAAERRRRRRRRQQWRGTGTL